MESREDFLSKLREAMVDARRRFYRNLVFIEKENFMDDLSDVISAFFEGAKEARVAYAFHPWADGAKERFELIRGQLRGKVDDIDYSSSEYYLGKTYDLVVLDLVDNFQPNYLGRLTDLASGGGLVIMYTNDLTKDKLFRNSIAKRGVIYEYYEERFRRKLREHEGVFLAGSEYLGKPFTGEVKVSQAKSLPKRIWFPKELHELCASEDQNKVLEEFRTLNRGGSRVLVLVAPRGRGKSAVAGLALAGLTWERMNSERRFRAVITAPSLSSASQVMEFARLGLKSLGDEPDVTLSDVGLIRSLKGDNYSIVYVNPETAVNEEGEVLVVDEAAAIGVNLLAQYVNNWKKVAFISTIYGYEGSGKAFLRYLRNLMAEKKVWTRWLTMNRPLRYAEGDPIEKWLYDALVLNAEPISPKDLELLEYETLDKGELFRDDSSLSQVYGILVSAHYRNNPDDLMIMGDGPHHVIKAMRSRDGYVAVSQISEEGGLQDTMIDLSLRGGTFDGDLIPDRLLKHSRIRDIGNMRGWRIVRIAVVQESQGMGIGSAMLNFIVSDAERQGLDWVGSSFMGDPKVLRFWVKNGFYPVHVSPKRNEKFGDFPVVVIKPLTDRARKAVGVATAIFKEKLLNTIHDVYFNMTPDMAVILLRGAKTHREIAVSRVYLAKIAAFLQGSSPYESSADGIHLLVQKYFWDSKRDWELTEDHERVLVAKVLQGRPWSYLISTIGMSRSRATELLYEAVSILAKKYYNVTEESQLGISLEDLGDEFTTL
ncbi:GNAT family N-acetyltransferase [Metallosphaera yellowstonensis]|uniref:GNAT family N-acetyltransferase n=1 Tax=Metallosphaera yellowstonensis TaxID=1111107 RepID=UPI000A722490